jgi:integrase
MKLTMNRIGDLACPAGKRDKLVFDDEQPGLGVRVTASGGKTYLAQYVFRGQKRRVPLGKCDAVDLKAARLAARAILGAVASGRDPAKERKAEAEEAKQRAAREALTLDTLIADWERLHLAGKRPRYASEAVRALKFAFAKQLDAPAADLDRAAVVKILDGLTKKGHAAMASRTAAYGKAAYGWAIKRGTLDVNPFGAIPTAPTTKRDRVLSDVELKAIWRATDGAGVFNSIVRFLLLTGQRRDEVGGMTWDEISADLSTWTLPATRAKNGAAHVVPVSKPARALLGKRGSGPVFPGRDGTFGGWSKSKAALDRRMLAGLQDLARERGEDASEELADWRLHDLRRTVATGLQRLGVRLEVTEAVQNHVSGSRAGIVGVYQQHDWAKEKRAALEAWGKRVMTIVR